MHEINPFLKKGCCNELNPTSCHPTDEKTGRSLSRRYLRHGHIRIRCFLEIILYSTRGSGLQWREVNQKLVHMELDQVDLQVPNVAMKRNFFVAKKTKRFQTFLCRFNAKNAACPKRVGTILATFAGGRALREPTPINWLSPQEGTNSFRPIHFPLGVIIHHKIDRVGAIGSFGVVLDGR
jgi:hypothetical protein